jgi:hypothetical protein
MKNEKPALGYGQGDSSGPGAWTIVRYVGLAAALMVIVVFGIIVYRAFVPR